MSLAKAWDQFLDNNTQRHLLPRAAGRAGKAAGDL